MKEYIRNIVAGLLIVWATWVSTSIVDNKVTIVLVEYKVDSLNPVLQDVTTNQIGD